MPSLGATPGPARCAGGRRGRDLHVRAGLSLATFGVIKATFGLRVSEEDEDAGLDITSHGMYGYPEAFIPQEEYPTGDHVPAVAGTPVAIPSKPAEQGIGGR